MATRSLITPSFLSSLSIQPHLPANTWYFIAATALCLLNRQNDIPAVYTFAIESLPQGSDISAFQQEQLSITRRMREALIKAAAVGGVPKSINALLALKSATPERFQDQPLGVSATSRRRDIYDTQPSQILQRGQDFFEKIYGKVSRRVMGQMDCSGTEDLGLVARLVYGHILSNTSILSASETSYVMIAGLIPQDVNPQLKGHLRGALNGGASAQEVRAVRDIVIRVCEASGMSKLDDTTTSGWGWKEDVANI